MFNSDCFSEALGSPGRYFGRRTVSMNPDRQLCATRCLQDHQTQWGKSIGYFTKRRTTETEHGAKIAGTSLLATQTSYRAKELLQQDSFLELEQIYARQTGITER